VLFGTWALVHVAVFSLQRGIFHPYYVTALAPAVAALSGAGIVTLWDWARRSWVGLAALDGALVLCALVALRLLARTPDFAPVLRTAIPVALAIALFGSLGLRMPQLFGRRTVAVAAVAGALALSAGPVAYSAATVSHALNGNDVTAGPSSIAGGLRGGGAMRGGGVSDELIAYLRKHQGAAKYLVAASGSQTTAPIIVATGEAVVTIGGFSGQDAAPTAAQLADMVAAGELRYILLGGQGPGPRGASSELQAWVQEHGTVVDGVETGGMTLYRVAA
jgi:4-amino-4-deoxy-L-arabinose transferase-like glycosyltransferase